MDQTINDVAAEVNQALKEGRVFLTSHDEKTNAMIIGWGGILNFWTKPVFLAPVRLSRYTHDPIQKTGYFTISIPRKGELKNAVAFCGSRSGRDHDKLAACRLTAVPGKAVPVPVIGECALHFECRVLLAQDMDLAGFDADAGRRYYADGDIHTMFFGEILACYTTD